jgi:iron complex outermembrane receptor protein
MNRISLSLFLGFGSFSVAFSQQDTAVWQVDLPAAAVTAVRATERSPFVHVELNEADIAARNAGQDLPYMLRFTPSAVVTSDAGAGVGYTGMRLRGSDATRINVTINGIPLNDAESQGVYWVDLPDLASGVNDIQVVRGAGGSTFGAGAFGGAISVNTLDFSGDAGGSLQVGAGSFGTRRSTVQFSTGRMESGWAVKGRLSSAVSDGYIDRASSDLRSLQLSLERSWKGGRAIYTLMDGHERTYQAWWGVPEVALSGDDEAITSWAAGQGYSDQQTTDLLNLGRRSNYYTYENEVDDYGQKHQQFHLEQRAGAWDLSTALHWTAGAGFYEQSRPGDALANYGLAPVISAAGDTVSTADIVRRRWLDNDFYGLTLGGTRNWDRAELTLGGAYHVYEGAHFGELIWLSAPAASLGDRYYESTGTKTDASGFARFVQRSSNGRWQGTIDLQLRDVGYSTSGLDSDRRPIEISGDAASFLFFNPKLGVDYRVNDQTLAFASFSQANKEPSRADWIDAPSDVTPRPEHLNDLELGLRSSGEDWALALTAFHMDYRDQLVLTGALNDVGSPIRTNVDRSRRVGLELEGGWRASDAFEIGLQATLMRSSISDFQQVVYDYTDGYAVVVNAFEQTDIAFSPRSIASAQLLWHALDDETIGLDLEASMKHVGRQFLDNTSNADRSIAGYNIGELRASWRLEFGAASESVSETALRLDFWVHNALDAVYSSNGYTYSYVLADMVTENFYYPQAGRHYSLGLRYEF